LVPRRPPGSTARASGRASGGSCCHSPAPGLAATAILCFLYSWNDFFFALILTRTEAMTAPVAVVNLMNYERWEWGKIAAGGTMVMLPVLSFSILVRRFPGPRPDRWRDQGLAAG
jgi:ABC-type spermidine/putrescine transport system permease subunit II